MNIGDFDLTQKTMIIAEIGENHNGYFETAVEMVRKAAESRADAVKFQAYRAEGIVTKVAPSHVPSIMGGGSPFEHYRRLELSKEQFQELARLAKQLGMVFLSSVFDEECADMVEELVPAFKIASGDLTNLPLIRHVAKKGKPIILSTGMASIEEVREAIKGIPEGQLVLLHCVSRYPAPIEIANLRTIPFLKEEFSVPVGYSDHTVGTIACVAAVALGAVLIEKHFTLDKSQPVGDHRLSAEPQDFKQMVDDIRKVEEALGRYAKQLDATELEMRKLARRSLVARDSIPKGTILTKEMLVPLRPAMGISPSLIDRVVGKRTARAIEKDAPLVEEDIVW